MRFGSAHQAVRWAFAMTARSEYARVNLLAVGGGPGALSPTDLHAQAGMILSGVSRLPGFERSIVVASCGRGRERADAVRAAASRLFPGLSPRVPTEQDVALVAMHWLTRRPTIRALAESRSISYREACRWRSDLARAWLPAYARAMDSLHDSLVSGGMSLGP